VPISPPVPPTDPSLLREWDALHSLRADDAILREIADRGVLSELALQQQLRKRFPDDLVRVALVVAEMRAKASAKFSRAALMWFDRIGFEQSTGEEVARHKAQRFSGTVLDLCCGIGGDAVALAEVAERIVAVDQNPLACLRTAWNAEVHGVGDRIEPRVGGAEEAWAEFGAGVTGAGADRPLVHVDPDRRAGTNSRAVRIEDYAPGLEFMERLFREARGGAVKLSPAANFTGRFPGTEIEIVSLAGEAKEATVWFGELAGETPYRATVLPSGETIAGHPLDFAAERLTAPGGWLFDPDPAVVRAGLVDSVAERLGLARLDDEEEYLSGPEGPVNSHFVRSFRVLADLPNNDRHIRDWFRTHPVRQVEIKCRHVPIRADEVRRKLPLEGEGAAVLFFAKVAGRTRAIVAERAG
jgi:SAM-dependent methyltransferase